MSNVLPSDDVMPTEEIKTLLLLAKKQPVQAALLLTAENEGVLLLDKLLSPKKVRNKLMKTVKAAKLKVKATSLRFGRAEVGGDENNKTVVITVNKDVVTGMDRILKAVVKPAGFPSVVFKIDSELDKEAEPGDESESDESESVAETNGEKLNLGEGNSVVVDTQPKVEGGTSTSGPREIVKRIERAEQLLKLLIGKLGVMPEAKPLLVKTGNDLKAARIGLTKSDEKFTLNILAPAEELLKNVAGLMATRPSPTTEPKPKSESPSETPSVETESTESPNLSPQPTLSEPVRKRKRPDTVQETINRTLVSGKDILKQLSKLEISAGEFVEDLSFQDIEGFAELENSIKSVDELLDRSAGDLAEFSSGEFESRVQVGISEIRKFRAVLDREAKRRVELCNEFAKPFVLAKVEERLDELRREKAEADTEDEEEPSEEGETDEPSEQQRREWLFEEITGSEGDDGRYNSEAIKELIEEQIKQGKISEDALTSFEELLGQSLRADVRRENFKTHIVGKTKEVLKHLAVDEDGESESDPAETPQSGDIERSLKAIQEDPAYQSRKGFLSLREAISAKACGINFSDIDVEYRDETLKVDDKHGAGAVNTVFKLTYQNGKTGIFKPSKVHDLTERKGMLHTVSRNIAADAVGKLLGADVVVESRAVTHGGQVGLLMDVAPGTTAFYAKNALVKNFSYEKLNSLHSRLNELEWVDVIMAQEDRKNDNYFVDVSGDPVKVTGIDNDFSFNANHQIQPSKDGSSYEVQFERGTAVYRGTGMPELIGQKTYDRLLADDFIDKVLSKLRGRLTQGEIDSTSVRLKTLQEAAGKLASGGFLVKGDDWAAWTIVVKGKELNATQYLLTKPKKSLFERDFAPALIKAGKIQKVDV